MFPLADLHALRHTAPRAQDIHAYRAREILRRIEEERRAAARARRRARWAKLQFILRSPLRLLQRRGV